MNIKSLLADHNAAITDHWGSPDACPVHQDIIRLIEEIAHLKKRFKSESKEKQIVGAKFKKMKEFPAQIAELKIEMSVISKRLGEIESARKDKEKKLLAFFQDTQSELPPFPTRFAAPSEHLEPLSNSDRKKNNNEKIDIVIADKTLEAEWDQYVSAHPRASAYHAFQWRQVIEESFGQQAIYLVAKNSSEGSIVGVMPLIAFASRLFGEFAVSLPFFNYGGPLTSSEAAQHALLEYAENLALSNNWRHVEYRTCDPDRFSLPKESRKASMVLLLPASMELLEKKLGAKVRAQYKLAEKVSPQVSFGGVELLDKFYRVFSRNMRDLGTPVYGKAFFKNILHQFPEQATLVVVTINGKAMATAFLFGYMDMLEIPWASTLKPANKFNLNMWMYKNILDFAIQKKYQYFDFGRSTIDASTYKFKKQWGAQALTHHWYYYLPGDSALPKLNPDNPKYKLVIWLWKKLPVFITNVIGPTIIRNIP